MGRTTYIKIGRLNKTFGLKGHIHFFIEPKFADQLKKTEVFFLLIQNKYLPYFTNEVNITESGHGMIHFDEVDDKTIAGTLTGKEIFTEGKNLKKPKVFSSPVDYIGFKIIDEQEGELGMLEDVIQLPHHELGKFTYKGKEVLFPLHLEFIKKIEKKEKILYTILPDGLMDVYLK